MTTVNKARKFDPRKKWDRVSAYEQDQVVGRDKSYYLVQYGSQTYKVPRWQLIQS
jgi:deferrochelatase/peroxidase EfeB